MPLFLASTLITLNLAALSALQANSAHSQTSQGNSWPGGAPAFLRSQKGHVAPVIIPLVTSCQRLHQGAIKEAYSPMRQVYSQSCFLSRHPKRGNRNASCNCLTFRNKPDLEVNSNLAFFSQGAFRRNTLEFGKKDFYFRQGQGCYKSLLPLGISSVVLSVY